MKLRDTVTALALLAAPAWAAAVVQAPLSASQPAHTTSTTLVDVLSQDPDFSLLIRLLQHARLITTLNQLPNATLFAPTNDAIRRQRTNDSSDSLLNLAEQLDSLEANTQFSYEHDNLQYRLRERLFYHMLNYSLPENRTSAFDQSSDGRPTSWYEETLLHPTKHEDHGRPGHVPYPDPADTLLGGAGQKIRFLSRKTGNELATVIGVDEFFRGGAGIVHSKGGNARNGRVIAINETLDPPKSLARQIKWRQGNGDPSKDTLSLSRFASLLTEDIWKELQERSHITLFAPRDVAFDALHPLEWKYLTSGFAADDILEIAMNHQSELTNEGREKVGYAHKLIEQKQIPLLSGDSVTVSEEGPQIRINKSTVAVADILASNGVMHIVDSLILPHGSLALTPEKYLLALNATKFVQMFRSSGLSHLLRSTPHNATSNASYTILATQDDILERMSQLPYSTIPPEGSQNLAETLQYQIIEGKHKKKRLQDGQLLPTMLRTPSLSMQQQRIPVSVHTNPREIQGTSETSDIAFGDANVISDPIEVGNCIIYLVSRMIEPPANFVNVALDRGLSTFVASVYSSALDKVLLHQSPATTMLVPSNSAFDYLGLATNYFLLASSQEELGQLLKYHVINETVYLDELPFDSQHYSTLEGEDIFLERTNASSNVRVRGPRVGGFPANGDNRDGRVKDADLLTSTGVLHVVDQVELPPAISITSEKLMRGARVTTFLDLMRLANMSWIAEGRPPPQDLVAHANLHTNKDKIQKDLFRHESYTVLCPTDKAFTRINLTHYLTSPAALLALVQLHIIPSSPPSKSSLSDPMRFPSDGRPLAITDQAAYSTLYSRSEGGPSRYGDLAFRQAGESDWLVGIKGARGTNGQHDAARIINHGRNTPRFSRADSDEDLTASLISGGDKMVFGGGVLLIDSVLEPFEPTWFQRWGHAVVGTLVCIAGAAVVGILAWKLYERRKRHAAQYEALRQDALEED